METTLCSTVECWIPELSALRNYHASSSPYLGHQDFRMGCLIAVNQSLTIVNGHQLSRTETFFFVPNTTSNVTIITAARDGTICHSTNGSAPEVRVPYDWCLDTLPGWEASSWSGVLGPLVQFILPCVAFCYNIPREWTLGIRRLSHSPKIPLRRWLPGLGRIAEIAETLINRTIALVMVVLQLVVLMLDTFLWMSICFAMAGPMILSAAYEYRLDWNNLAMLGEMGAGLPNVSRARLLLCTVAGNMKLGDDKMDQDEEMINMLEPQTPQSTWGRVMSVAEEVRRLESSLQQVESQHNQLQLASPGHRSVHWAQGVGPRLKLQALLDAQPGQVPDISNALLSPRGSD